MIRKAVILAAGMGTRMRADGTTVPKPLRVVGGLTLLHRTILTMATAGVRQVGVVVGYEADLVKQAIWRDARLWARKGVTVQFLHNPEYELSNGVSVMAAEPFVDGTPFLLSMSDHVYDVDLPRLAARSDMAAADLYLCVDRRVDEIYDPDDATKVVTRGDQIVEIGKQLATWDCVDCGVFCASQALIDALGDVRAARGDCSLSDGVRRLAASGRARVIDIGQAFWQDVDTPEAHRRATRELARRSATRTIGTLTAQP